MKNGCTTLIRALGWAWLTIWTLGLAAACSSSSSSEESSTLTSHLTKGQIGAVNGQADYCDDPSNLCAAGEGDCDARGQCVSGLACGTNYGPRYGFSNTTSVCMPPTCADNMRNGSETGIDCGGNCAPCLANCSGSAGSATLCSQGGCLCGQGQGNCTVNAECQGGLSCLRLGAQFGYSTTTRVCAPARCANGVQDGDETGVDCGGACGTCLPTCTGTPGALNFCDACKCTAGQGDCAGNQQCAAGLICTRMGNQFGFASNIDVCLPAHCSNTTMDGDETGVDCGGSCGTCLSNACTGTVGDANFCSGCKCSSGQGDCDSNADCQTGLTCQAKGRAFGFSSSTAVCLSSTCSNGVQDGGETGVDCGGSCGTCLALDFDAGTSHMCATVYGEVRCWGSNSSGQLGDGTTTAHSSPAPVTGLSSGYTLVTAGDTHSCALSSTGSVKCWGSNSNGRLGNGNTTTSYVPVDVTSPPTNIVQLKAGDSHTCVLTSAGAVYCWGNNAFGQCGNSLGGSRLVPTQVSGVSGAIDLATGSNHTCVALSDHTVRCWGQGFFGQLGNNTSGLSSSPVTAIGVTSAIGVAAGQLHSCALLSTGGVMCWGSNANNTLAIGAGLSGGTPAPVVGLTGATQLAAARSATCAATNSGLQCWGTNSFGEGADGTTLSPHSAPTAVAGLSNVSAVRGGGNFFCARAGDSLSCWGDDSLGQLGKRTVIPVLSPKQVVSAPSAVTALATADNVSCAVAGGKVYCWGLNDSGLLGDGTQLQRRTPNLVSGIASAIDVAVGPVHACAVLSDHTVSCWGDNSQGQFGAASPASSMTPVAVPGLTNINRVYVGYAYTCALSSDSTLYCWGYNGNGDLGRGDTTASPTPMAVPGLTGGVTAAAAGPNSLCAVVTGGAVYCWGFNGQGQTGSSTLGNQLSALQVAGLPSAASSVAVGAQHACAALANGQVYCWGDGSRGQLGNNAFQSGSTPVAVSGVSTAVAVSAWGYHSCLQLSNGSVQCWGAGDHGQLGIKSTQTLGYPATAITSGVSLIAAGGTHSCALRAGFLFCWGANDYGEVGITTSSHYPAVAAVIGL